jgi:AcrR family transcriptional regulator
VLAAATEQFRGGDRVDLRAIASALGLGRATVYRWFGSRAELIGEVLGLELAALIADARGRAAGAGAQALLDTFDRMNRALATSAPLRRFLEIERDAGLRLLTSSGGPVQPRAVAAIAALIEAEVRVGAYRPPVDTGTLAYAIVRLFEAFVYNDAAAGIRGDIDRLREVEAALLGVALPPVATPRSPRRSAPPGAASARPA